MYPRSLSTKKQCLMMLGYRIEIKLAEREREREIDVFSLVYLPHVLYDVCDVCVFGVSVVRLVISEWLVRQPLFLSGFGVCVCEPVFFGFDAFVSSVSALIMRTLIHYVSVLCFPLLLLFLLGFFSFSLLFRSSTHCHVSPARSTRVSLFRREQCLSSIFLSSYGGACCSSQSSQAHAGVAGHTSSTLFVLQQCGGLAAASHCRGLCQQAAGVVVRPELFLFNRGRQQV